MRFRYKVNVKHVKINLRCNLYIGCIIDPCLLIEMKHKSTSWPFKVGDLKTMYGNNVWLNVCILRIALTSYKMTRYINITWITEQSCSLNVMVIYVKKNLLNMELNYNHLHTIINKKSVTFVILCVYFLFLMAVMFSVKIWGILWQKHQLWRLHQICKWGFSFQGWQVT